MTEARLLIEKQSNEFRRDNGLGSTSPLNLKSLLLRLNVLTFFKKVSHNFSGMALKSGETRFMMVNTAQNLGRQHFTICHELYHLFIQKDFTSETTIQVGRFEKNEDTIEYYADLFASYLLMPKEAVLELIPNHELSNKDSQITLDTVVKLEQYFQVSRSAMLMRLKSMRLISWDTYNSYKENIKLSAARRGFSTNLYSPTDDTLIIGEYGDLANSLVENGLISEGDYFSLMMDIGVDVMAAKNENDNNAS